MPDLSLVVPAFVIAQRVIDCAPRTLAAYRDSGVDLELIVVDNGSDYLNDLLRESADIPIRFEENQGYSGGVNAGLKVASAPVVGIGSIDILTPPGWGRKFLEAAPKVASALETGHELKYQKVRGAYWGALFTFPAEALETVGLMDTVTFSAWADRDYGIRLAQAGYDFCRVDVPVEHLASNHAHKHLNASKKGYAQEFSKEVRALRAKYGVQEWLEYWEATRGS